MKDIVLKATPEVREFAKKFGFEVAEASALKVVNAGENFRTLIEQKKVRGVYDVELLEFKDSLHYRRSGLNHIICSLMKKNNVSWVVNLRTLLSLKGSRRSLYLGRVMQNIELCRKYGVSMRCGSFAEQPEHLRSLHDVEALLRVLGMREVEASEVWEW